MRKIKEMERRGDSMRTPGDLARIAAKSAHFAARDSHPIDSVRTNPCRQSLQLWRDLLADEMGGRGAFFGSPEKGFSLHKVLQSEAERRARRRIFFTILPQFAHVAREGATEEFKGVMLKKLILAGALSLGALGYGAVEQAQAGTDIDIDIGMGGGYYQPGPNYYGGGYGGGRISCREGGRIVASAGFRRVRPIDCNGTEYSYRGMRRGDMFKIVVKSRTGHIKKVNRIRGGYDDDYDY